MLRLFVVLTLVLLPATAEADACQIVRWRSLGKIACFRQDSTAVLVYNSSWVWRKVTSSGRRKDMLAVLCAEKGTKSVYEVIPQGEKQVGRRTFCFDLVSNQ